MQVHEQQVTADETVWDDLRRRVRTTRYPTAPVRDGWHDGASRAIVEDLAAYWADGFDWPGRLAALNRHLHVTVPIDGVDVHAMVARPSAPTRKIPILAIHGWPSTFEQMAPLADRLIGDGRVVVAPSLPGFGFSAAPREAGWDLARIAAALDRLMSALGFDRYVVRGTDYGLGVALHLGARTPHRAIGIHLGGTHLDPASAGDLPVDLTSEEKSFIHQARVWQETEGAYIANQQTKPETLGFALSDSPVGLLAWIVEKFRTWCATPDDVFQTFTRDDLLSTATMYWQTNSIASSLRLYREDLLGADMPRSVAPVAIHQPALEEYPPPPSWWARSQPLVRHTVLPGASHFPEWEQPDLLHRDLVAFADSLDPKN